MDPSSLAQNVLAASPMLLRESDTERSCTDTYRITPKNILLGRRTTGRKGWFRGPVKRSQTQTRAIVSRFFRTLHRTPHRVSLHRHPSSPKSPTMMTSGRCPSTSRICTPRNHSLSPYRLNHGPVIIPPTLFKISRQRRNRRPCTFRSHCPLRVLFSPHRLRPGLVMLPPILFSQRRNRRPL